MITATLGGVHLNLQEQGGLGWILQGGVQPFQRAFFCTDFRALDIFERNRGKPLELKIQVPGYDTLRVQDLYILQLLPVDENRISVFVSDARWRLSREWLIREYNVRRRTGDYRLLNRGMVPLEVQPLVPDVGYKRVTTNNGRRWTAREILEDVLSYFFLKYRIEELPYQIDVEDLVLDDPGDSALQRVLSYLPGAQIYVDLDGTVVAYNELSGGEVPELKRIRAREDSLGKSTGLWGGGTVIKVDRSSIRPSEISVLFERECEVRFDFTGSARTRVPGREPRELEQVIPVVDPWLLINGKNVTYGTFVPLADWIAGVNSKNDAPARAAAHPLGSSLTEDMIRREYLSGFAYLHKFFATDDAKQLNPIWAARLNALEEHWRKTYRIRGPWMDKIKTVRPYRVAVLDQETGAHGKAEAYFDYTLCPSGRTLLRQVSGGNMSAANVITSWAANLDDGQPAPAEVSILDEDTGVFQLALRTDVWGDYVQIAPGTLDLSNAPQVGPDNLYTVTVKLWHDPRVGMTGTFQASVVLTVTMASPNDKARCKEVVIRPAETKLDLGECLGPPSVVKIGPGILTARYAWLDTRAVEIEEAWFSGKEYPDDLIVNPDHIHKTARAAAMRLYAYMQDRYEGAMTVSWDPSVKPTGSLSHVAHLVSRNGNAFTNVQLPPITMPTDLFALLPDSVRKIIQRQVVP